MYSYKYICSHVTVCKYFFNYLKHFHTFGLFIKPDFIFDKSAVQINCLEVAHLKNMTPPTKSDMHVKGQPVNVILL